MVLILFIGGIVVLKLRPRNQGLYKVTILPSLGGKFTLPHVINDYGQVAGFSEISNGNYHLFLWNKENGMQDLGAVEYGYVFINNTGQIAANIKDPNSNIRSFIWDPNAGSTIIPTLGGKNSTVFGINNRGQVVGYAETTQGINHAFVWDSINGIRDLTLTSTKSAAAYSINDTEQVVVNEKNATLLVETNKNLTITSLPTRLFGILQINNNSYIIGMISWAAGKFDIVLWHPDLGQKTLFRSDGTASYNMNDNNQLIITEQKDISFFSRYFFTHMENHMLDPKIGLISLDGYFSAGKYKNLCLTDINNKGFIIGAVQSTKDSKSRGVLFEPIPEKKEQMSRKAYPHE